MVSEFSYLNITSIGRNLIQDENDCGYACLEIPACFSYNVAAFSDVNGKLLCELLPSDKFNHSDKFNTSREFHHFYLPVSLLLIYHNSLFSRGNYSPKFRMLAFVNEQREDLFARKILKNSTIDFGFKPFKRSQL